MSQLPPTPEEELELLETSLPLADEQPTERPKRRRYQRRNREEAEDVVSSSADTERPRRRYQRRVVDPIKIVERDAEPYQAQLAAMFMLVGGAVSMLAPVSGTTLVVRAEQGSAAIVEAAKANPKIAAALIALLKAGHYGPLAMFGLTMIVAVGVDLGAVPPFSPPAQMLIKDVIDRFPTAAATANTTEQNGYAAQATGDVSA